MKEIIFEFVNQYAVWGILVMTALVVFALWRIHRQVKKLNRSMGTVTGSIQSYLEVIMTEEPEEEAAQPEDFREKERSREAGAITREEREMLLNGRARNNTPDEAAFHAVLQEYFS